MLIQKKNVSRAGGALLQAAFSFLGEMLPEKGETLQSKALAEQFKKGLSECLEQDDDGNLNLTVTLPNADALSNLANSLARIASP